MKKNFFSRLVSGFVSSMLCFAALPTFTSQAADQQQLGNKDGYDYELWNQWGQGTATMDVGRNGAFTCSWTGIENCLFRTGQKLGSTKSYEDYNGMYIDYDVDYEPKGNSYMCVYGWTEDPTVEYYIVEAWGSWRPPGSNDVLGTVEANGNTYDIYRTVRENQPSIHGTETFYQYWSVRQDNPAQNNVKKHIEGRISVSKHFEGWEKAGLDMSGKMYEVALNIEGYQSEGSAAVNKNGLVIGEGDGDGGSSVTPPTVVEPDENGIYFRSTFEEGNNDWGNRGDAAIKTVSTDYYAGKNSLFVSGRTDNWNGAAISLDKNAFVPGNSYSFSTAVLQKSGATTAMQLTLQYTLNGEDVYDQVAAADVKSGEWTKLENTSFTIPEGAKNMLLYVEAPDSLTDFYIDEAVGAKAGKKSTVVTGGGIVEGAVSSTPATTAPAATTPTVTTPADDILYGDANEDGFVDLADATAIIQHIGNEDKYGLSEQGLKNADCYYPSTGVTGADAIAIQQIEAKIISELPVGDVASTPAEPTVNDNCLDSSFETGANKWDSRGNASIKLDTANYYSGKSSLFVSGRTDSWNGAAVLLDKSDFIPGNSYSFSAAVMQKSGSATAMQMTLQYTLDGKDNYDQIASADVKSGVWTKLENTSFTIPKGATDLLLYIEAPDSLTDFYIDNAVIAKSGTKSEVVTGKGTVDETTLIISPVEPTAVDISWIDPTKPMVAISFDDGAVGSDPEDSSMRIINAVADSGFHATFFYIGDWISNSGRKAEVAYAHEKGMEIANHTTSHPRLTEKTNEEIRSEYEGTYEKLKSIIGAEPSKLLRLPYLAVNDTVKQTLNDVPMITCSIDTGDWNNATTDDIINKIITAKDNGSLDGAIVLAHETYDTTAEAMEYLAPYLKSEGWQIVTISEMFAVKNQSLNGGQVYTKVN